MISSERDGAKVPMTMSGPLIDPPKEAPPRNRAPGPASAFAPARHMKSSLKPPHPGHAVESGTQSATHSIRLPTMSNAPRADTQPARAPVGIVLPRCSVLQSVVPLSALSGPGSGVPFAPTCHSALVGNRLPELAQASCAWNQVMNAEGISAGKLTA